VPTSRKRARDDDDESEYGTIPESPTSERTQDPPASPYDHLTPSLVRLPRILVEEFCEDDKTLCKTDDGDDDDEYVVVDDQCSYGANATDDQDEEFSWDMDFDPVYEDDCRE